MAQISSDITSQIEHIRERCNEIKPLVVIRCITYNQERYLRDALESFVMQKTDFPFVAVVHDDASTDNNAAIIKEFAEKYPDIIFPIYEKENQYSKMDGSLREIMKAAVDATGAKYVAFCEGDDYWIDPLKLQKQVDFLEANPELSLVHTGFKTVSENNEILYESTYENYMDFSEDGSFLFKLLFKNYILTCTILIKKEVLNSQFFLNSPDSLDYLIFVSSAIEGKAKYIPEKTSAYRRNGNGAILSQNPHVKKAYDKIYNYTIDSYLNKKFKVKSIKERLKINNLIGYRFKSEKMDEIIYKCKLKPVLTFYIPFKPLFNLISLLKK